MKQGVIKILQMPIRNAKGGITQYALRNWEHINKNRFCFDWITLDKELSFEQDLIRQGCTVYHLSCRQEDNEAKFRAEMEGILSNGYDAVHLHTSFWRGFLAEELAINAKIPRIIVHAHSTGIDNPDSTERKRLLEAHKLWKSRFSADMATHFAACSSMAAEFLFGQQIQKEQIVILKNAIDTVRFAFNAKMRLNMRSEMNLDDKFVIMQAARLEYQKNHTFTLKVLGALFRHIPNMVLLFVGDGELRASLEREAEELGIAANVKFLGFRHDMPELLQAADLLMLPSLFEGFGLAAIEGQCSGIRCLLSNNVPDEAVVSDNAMRLPLDIDSWKNAITCIVRDGYVRRNRSSEVAAAGYSLKEQIGVLERIYAREEK